MDELVVPVSQSGRATEVCGEDVPDCGPLEIVHELPLSLLEHYAPEVVDHVAFCGGNDHALGWTVSAVNLATGTAKWVTPTDDWMEISPIPVGENVIVATDAGSVYCLRQSDGSIVWLHEDKQYSDIWCLAVSGSVVLCGTLHDDVFALDAATGAQRWMVAHSDKRSGSMRGNLVVWRDNAIFCITDEDLLCLDMKTGRERWCMKYGMGPADDHMNPLLVGDLLFIPSLIGGVHAVDLATRQLSWAVGGDSCARTPVSLGGVLYYREDDDGLLYGTPFRPSNTLFPKPLLEFETGSVGSEALLSALSVHDHRLYCPSGRWMYVIEPRPADGIPIEYHIRRYSAPESFASRYSAPESFATGLAHDGELFCAGTMSEKFVVGRIPHRSTTR